MSEFVLSGVLLIFAGALVVWWFVYREAPWRHVTHCPDCGMVSRGMLLVCPTCGRETVLRIARPTHGGWEVGQ